jgi:hypothetical protein
MDDKVKKKLDKDEKELHSQMEKTFSRRRGVTRVIVGLLALLLGFLLVFHQQ